MLPLLIGFVSSVLFLTDANLTPNFRPPAVPLIVTDPYTSYWSVSNNLYDAPPQHWSGSEMGLFGMIRIDSHVYRFMGYSEFDGAMDCMEQVNLSVYPTQTVYVFKKDGVQLTLTFSTPAVMEDSSEFVGLPVTIVSFNIIATDQMTHKVELYYDNSAEGCVSDTSEMVMWDRPPLLPGEIAMRFGSAKQKFASEASDRINWGYWYLSTILTAGVDSSIGDSSIVRKAFRDGSHLPQDNLDKTVPCKNGNEFPVLAVRFSDSVGPNVSTNQFIRIFYDQENAISYYGTVMQPLWKHYYGNFSGALREVDREKVMDVCNSIDRKVMAALNEAGGSNYATLGSLAWRQAIGGLTAVWNNVANVSWIFLKEISSDGDVSTVDVLFPASPLYLWASPEAMKSMLLPILSYANNETNQYGLFIPYNLAWAPHHLGHWPVCNLAPHQQEQMPVEESGNMLMMIAAVVKLQRGSVSFLEPYWGLLKIWADFIIMSLPDPGDQLCTDDFEGPSPHNINLAAKGIVGLSSYVYLLQVKGDSDRDILRLETVIQSFIDYWTTKGMATTSDHYARQFDLLNSWSLKYNFLFQKILNIDGFADSVFNTELSYYEEKLTTYGIPLDDRHPYTKTDWLMWVAAFADDSLFQRITDSVYKFANETPDRVPFTDWYNVETGKRQGFKARPVIGGIFARLLTTGMPHQEPID